MVRGLTKREHVALSVAFNEILPPGFRAFMDIVRGRDKRSVPARTKQWIENVEKRSVEQLAQDRIEAAQSFPVNAFVDAIMEFTQKTSPERLATIASYVAKNVSTTDLVQLGSNGIDFAQEFMQAATHGNPFKMTYSTRVDIFGAQLKHILNVVEEALMCSRATTLRLFARSTKRLCARMLSSLLARACGSFWRASDGDLSRDEEIGISKKTAAVS